MISGTYINVNYKDSPFISSPDTLILAEDNTFYSKKLGYGNYKIAYMFTRTKISLFGRENMHLHVNRNWSGNPKINIYFDLNHHYRKISSTGRISKATKNKATEGDIEQKKRIEAIQKSIQEQMYD